MTIFNQDGEPIFDYIQKGDKLPPGYSYLPFFPGYKFENGKSTYRGEEVGEGGYVYAEPGIYTKVALLDIVSMHPTSIIAEHLFGPYTKNFADIKDARVHIKHKEYDIVRHMLDGKMAPYLEDPSKLEDLPDALKIAINSVYGLTSANFENPFRDPRNVDNIVAKRGALFMINLKHVVQEQGFTVAHIKTDSIKIPNATPEIIELVMNYGQAFGYAFEHEATYDRMCLVNDAVYIAKYDEQGIRTKGGKHANEWTATGTQFQVPYVFKTLFSKEPIEFEDLCETKSVEKGAIYIDRNENLENVEAKEEEIKKLETKLKKQKFDEADIPAVMEHLKELKDDILKGHKYEFVGRVGLFSPVKAGCGGGYLVRKFQDNRTGEEKYANVADTSGYRWEESYILKETGLTDRVDMTYYHKKCDDAIATISKYGDFEWFVTDDDGIPPWYGPEDPWGTDEDEKAFLVR